MTAFGPRTTDHPFIPDAECPLVRVTGDGVDPIVDAWPLSEMPYDQNGIEIDPDEDGHVGFYVRHGDFYRWPMKSEEPWNPVFAGDACELYRAAWEAPVFAGEGK